MFFPIYSGEHAVYDLPALIATDTPRQMEIYARAVERLGSAFDTELPAGSELTPGCIWFRTTNLRDFHRTVRLKLMTDPRYSLRIGERMRRLSLEALVALYQLGGAAEPLDDDILTDFVSLFACNWLNPATFVKQSLRAAHSWDDSDRAMERVLTLYSPKLFTAGAGGGDDSAANLARLLESLTARVHRTHLEKALGELESYRPRQISPLFEAQSYFLALMPVAEEVRRLTLDSLARGEA